MISCRLGFGPDVAHQTSWLKSTSRAAEASKRTRGAKEKKKKGQGQLKSIHAKLSITKSLCVGIVLL